MISLYVILILNNFGDVKALARRKDSSVYVFPTKKHAKKYGNKYFNLYQIVEVNENYIEGGAE